MVLRRLPAAAVLALAAFAAFSSPATAQEIEFKEAPYEDPVPVRPAFRPGAGPPGSVAPAPDKPADVLPADDVVEIDRSETPVAPRHVRLHLRDGSVLAGDLTVDKIDVETDFGRLSIPVERIVSFRPGLESSPERLVEIDELVEKLGHDDFNTREQAQKDLLKLGLPLRREIEQRLAANGDENAERRTRLAQILKDLEQQADQVDESADSQSSEPWARQDTIVTAHFTVVGKIVDQEFKVVSKYGSLDVKLGDITFAGRAGGAKPEVRRTVVVAGTNLAQTNFKSSGLRVERGDKVTVRADGQIQMTPWGGGHSTTPDGGAYYGWYRPNEIEGGSLVAKIGDSGPVFKVGSKKTFVARQSGVIQFAMAMQDQYSQQGYQFPGQYNVKVSVEPK
jgi:hypothetical protein